MSRAVAAGAGTPAGGGGTVQACLREAERRLTAAGVPDAAREARLLTEEVLGCTPAALVLARPDALPTAQATKLAALVERRAGGEPLQYVLGHWAFRTLDLLVDPRVLIPRPETEVVAGHALALLEKQAPGDPAVPLRVVDLGTGSGALALAVAVECPRAEVWAVERSGAALAVADANRAALGSAAARVHLVEGSWFEQLPLALQGRVDVVVSNPPYVAAGEALPAEVAKHEPRGALVAGPTGLEAIAVIVAGAGAWLAPGGALVVEIGASQGSEAIRLARAAGLPAAAIHRDLAGRDRVLVARLPESAS